MAPPTFNNIHLTGEPSECFVLVEDISDKVNENDVRDFFNFCGTIRQFQVVKNDDNALQTAVLEFEKASAAKTALLLDKALLGDKAISIHSYFDKYPAVSAESSESGPALTQEDKPKISIVSELLAKGYLLSDDIVNKAKKYDEENGVTARFYHYMDYAKNSTAELDHKYKVSETVSHTVDDKIKPAADSISQKAKETYGKVDENYHVNENIHKAEEALKENLKFVDTKVNEITKQALETETGKYMSSWLSSVYNNAQSMVGGIYNDSVKIYEQQKGNIPGDTSATLNAETDASASQAEKETEAN